jgi:hypothetical protein
MRQASLAVAAGSLLLAAGCPQGMPPGPQASFSASPRGGEAPLSVQFTDTSGDGGAAISGWHWDFGDGGISAEQHPQHLYAAPGDYSVSLSVVTAAGVDAIVRDAYIEVRAAADETPPVITLEGAPEIHVECGAEFNDPGARATDEQDGDVRVRSQGAVSEDQPGRYTIVYTARDRAGNAAAAVTRTVRVADTTPPVVRLWGGNATISCADYFEDPGARAEDLCAGEAPVVVEGRVLLGVPGQYTLRYTASDASGNVSSTVERVVTIEDVHAPVLRLSGGDVFLGCGEAYVEPGATAEDDCDGAVAVRITGSVGAELGAYTLRYEAVDAAGNAARPLERVVTVLDLDPPIITINGGDMDLECGAAFVDPGATAVDGCAGPVEVTVSGLPLPDGAGELLIAYGARDPAGNAAARVERRVRIADTVPPDLSLIGDDMSIYRGTAFSDPGARAQDACEGAVAVQVEGAVDTERPGEYHLSYSAVDSVGNAAGAVSRQVTVVEPCLDGPPWARIYGRDQRWGHVVQTSDCNFVLATADGVYEALDGAVMLRKLDPEGALLWETAYEFEAGHFDDLFALENGDVALTGESQGSLAVVRMDGEGVLVWEAVVSNATANANHGLDLTEGGDGDLWISGVTRSVVRLSASGTTKWIRQHLDFYATAHVMTGDGEMLIAGEAVSDSAPSPGAIQPAIRLVNASGLTVWTKRYALIPGTWFSDIAKLRRGYVLGAVHTGPGSSNNLTVIGIDEQGEETWRSAYPGTLNEYNLRLEVTPRDEVVGAIPGYTPQPEGVGQLFKMDAAGKLLWQQNWTYQALVTSDFTATFDGGILVAADADEWIDRGAAVQVFKVSADGTLPGPPEVQDFPGWMHGYVLPTGQVAGPLIGTAGGYVMVSQPRLVSTAEPSYLLTVDTEGTPAQYFVAGPGRERISALAPHPEGFLLAGAHYNNTITASASFIRCIDTQGGILWDRRYSEEGPNQDEVAALVAFADGSGYLAAGTGAGEGLAEEGRAFKIGQDGHVLWERFFGDTGDDAFHAATGLADGSVVVAGTHDQPGDAQYYAVKLSTSGQTLWERQYDTDSTTVYCIAATDDGGLIFGGSHDGSSDRVAVVRTDGNGEARWVQTFNPGHNARAIAIAAAANDECLVGLDVNTAFYIYRLDSAGNRIATYWLADEEPAVKAAILPNGAGGFVTNAWRRTIDRPVPMLIHFMDDGETDVIYQDFLLE